MGAGFDRTASGQVVGGEPCAEWSEKRPKGGCAAWLVACLVRFCAVDAFDEAPHPPPLASLLNIFQFALMLVAVLFGGHSALHRWDLRTTRLAMLRRACKFPDGVARAWVEIHEGGKPPKLWLQFSGVSLTRSPKATPTVPSWLPV